MSTQETYRARAEIRAYWERRAERLGIDSRSVIFESFPPEMNGYIHSWQRAVLRRFLADRSSGSLLDLGCGYGRLSEEILALRPGISVWGLDFSLRFCRLFNEKVSRPAVNSDVRCLPFRDGSFDMVLASGVLTCLLAPQPVREAVSEIYRVLKTPGRCLLIENNSSGAILGHLFGAAPALLRLLRRSRPEKGRVEEYFRRGELERVFAARGMAKAWEAGIPVFSSLMAPLAVASRLSRSAARVALSGCRRADDLLGSKAGLSLYVAEVYFKD